MKFESMITLGMVGVLIIGVLLGVVGALFYQDYIMERTLNGIYIEGNISYDRTEEITNIKDKKGDWVCINVAYDMKPSEAYKTCVHECSHKAYTEIFAEWCEDDFEKCLGVVENE
jgi:hypothetical protein